MEEMERAGAPRAGAESSTARCCSARRPSRRNTCRDHGAARPSTHGYSEPNSGSDLARFARAVREGDEWGHHGQKIWTTTWWGNYMFLAARTDPNANPPHKGISTFIVPMTTPGSRSSLRARCIDGSFSISSTTNVRLQRMPLLASQCGWKVLTGALGTERGFVGRPDRHGDRRHFRSALPVREERRRHCARIRSYATGSARLPPKSKWQSSSRFIAVS